jgi:hypothetical protein
MAKTINLTVNVDDTDFKKFISDFNKFVAQIGALNKNFQQVNTTIAKSQQSAKGLLDTIKSAISGASSLYSWTVRIGRSLTRWGVAIGGIVSMLTTGAGLFGIDRLSESILQRRRQAMGMGTTRGGLLAAQIGGVGMFNDPAGFLQGIRTAMGGGPGAGALAGFGAFPGRFGSDPYKALPTIIRRLHQEITAAAPGTEVAVGRALTTQQGLSGIGDEDFIRLRQMTKKEVEETLKRMEEIRKTTDMEKEAQKKWFDLEITFRKAKAALESAFGERFQQLTKPLQELSDAFVALITALLKSKTVTDLITWLTTQLNKLTGELEKDPDALGKKIKEWEATWEKEWKPLLERLRAALEGFAAILERLFGKKVPDEQKGGWSDPWNWGSTVHDWLKKRGVPLPGPTREQQQGTPSTGTTTPPQTQQGTPSTTQPATQPPPPPAGTTTSPATNVPPWQREREQQGQRQGMFIPGTNLNQQFAGGRAFGMAAFGGAVGGNAIGVRGGNQAILAANNRFGFGGPNVGGSRNTGMGLAFGGSRGGDINIGDRTGGDIAMRGGNRRGMFASIRGGNRIALFGGATRSRVPGNEMNFTGMRAGNVSMASANLQRFNVNQRPLDVDNWQMNRTPSLTIRNVPGSNIYAQSSGFA